MLTNLLNDLRLEPAAKADEKTHQSGLMFFREDITMYGIK